MLIIGTASADTLNGTQSDDEIRGLEDNDRIAGNGGNDLIYGNLGNDAINVGKGDAVGNDTVYGGQGNDGFGEGSTGGADLVYGNFGDDSFDGGFDNDTIYGGQGNDRINAGGGSDLIYGNLGNDQLDGTAGNDTLFGGQGDDSVSGGTGNDVVYGNFGNDVLGRNDSLSEGGNDTLYGGQGNDFLIESGNKDTNSDLMFGNLGADTFDFSALDASGQTTATADRIADFSSAQGDKIEINIGFNAVEFQTISSPTIPINSVEAAISLATSPMNVFSSHNVVFVAGTTGGPDGYLLVDQNNDHSFGSPTDFAIVLQGANSTQAVHASDIVPIVDLIFPI